ncbi:aminodeoxychorismate/anthranilate synthase component II [Shewanella sp. D64]|uniref:anthranilate synthase component II n=1 Tax=unclassified Shewanella TaxID=196818 RepID=UPI0022BA4552|nr:MULTISPECIES: aminodeoxychorismate/anthranilate synthase component II [unclassified Shewanella]MEC4724651.1 aminodeoxychorismate/anthranilate synthase component II [Shewanella sp. D64]MEC4736572.1 aminodeoxychorismate/anthranilate synthase component II [Shewanella sp. E94]WBJ94753.1 aminodeoxychorismate/anthranilate synthase component II [Shewanella sp. MTB7]
MLLMIDNYDSFTFNLVQYFQQLGQEVVVKRNDEITITEIEALAPTHLVISPGPRSPNEAGISLAAIEYFAGKLPILGVCLGHQAIAQVFGAQVIRAKRVMHGKISNIGHSGERLFSELNQPLTVTRYHSLLVESLPNNFTLDAWFDDETHGREIMAMSHISLPIYGVQFHPESVLTEQGHELLQNFLNLG